MKSTDNNKKRKFIFIGVEELINITEKDPELLIGYDHLAPDNILKIHDAIYDYSNIEKNIDKFVNDAIDNELTAICTENYSDELAMSNAKILLKAICFTLVDMYKAYGLYKDNRLVIYPVFPNPDKPLFGNMLILDEISGEDLVSIEKLEELNDLITGVF